MLKKLLLLSALLLSAACVETVVASSVGVTAVSVREKSFRDTGRDLDILLKIDVAFMENGLKGPYNSIGVAVDEGRVLLTGVMENEAKIKLASELAWKVKGVKEVIDEVQVRDPKSSLWKSAWSTVSDPVITSEIKTKMLLYRSVSSFNFQVITINHIVYFLGVARTNDELDLVLTIASTTTGVKKVVNHVILVDDNRRNG